MTHFPTQRQRIASQFLWAVDPTAQQELLVSEHASNLPAAAASELLRERGHQVRRQVEDGPDTTWELPASRLSSEFSSDTLQRSQS